MSTKKALLFMALGMGMMGGFSAPSLGRETKTPNTRQKDPNFKGSTPSNKHKRPNQRKKRK